MLGGLALSSGDWTNDFFNIEYTPLNDLKTAILSTTSTILETLPAPKHKTPMRTGVPDITSYNKEHRGNKISLRKEVIIEN